MMLILYLLISQFLLSHSIDAAEKRLLVNSGTGGNILDQEVQNIRNRVLQIENEITNLRVLNTQIENENIALKTRVSKLETEDTRIRNQLRNTVSTRLFTIWGRKSCPTVNGTSTLYSGILGGKHYSEQGSGVNILCLPHDPDQAAAGFPSALYGGYYARLWGSEYQYSYKNAAIDDDAPCAVCMTTYASEVHMFPAKNSCPTGWLRQYRGFLIGALTVEYASDYICMDENPEYLEGTRSHSDNGRTLYPVRAACGSLPCPPYTQDQYVPCVVCST